MRKAADRVRVTVQLIDGETETHVWAERYDRKLEDIFAIQDEVTSAIVATLRGRVEAATQERVKRKRTENMAAYEYVLTGKVLHHWSARESNAEALRMLDKAIELDPKYAHAHAWKACVIGQAWLHGWAEDRGGEHQDDRRRAADRAVARRQRLRRSPHPRGAQPQFTTSSTRRPITRSGRSASIRTATSSSSSRARC